MIPTYVVIATYNRPNELVACVKSLQPVDRIFVIDDGSDISPSEYLSDDNVTVIASKQDEVINLSELWNIGLDAAHSDAVAHAYAAWNVAVVNDDIVAPPGWAAALSDALRAHPTAVLAYPDQFDRNLTKPIVHKKPKITNAFDRIVGYAHMMKGEIGLRYDEQFKWWYGDDDMDWQARIHGGSMLVPGLKVEHLYPDSSTNSDEYLYAQAGRDRQTFIEKWGTLPC